jgi:hypothetical protein
VAGEGAACVRLPIEDFAIQSRTSPTGSNGRPQSRLAVDELGIEIGRCVGWTAGLLRLN